MNVWQYGALSAVVLAAVVGNAYVQRQQFYLACVYLTHSNANVLFLYNTTLFSIFMFAKLVRKIFFGQLRAIELEVCRMLSVFSLLSPNKQPTLLFEPVRTNAIVGHAPAPV